MRHRIPTRRRLFTAVRHFLVTAGIAAGATACSDARDPSGPDRSATERHAASAARYPSAAPGSVGGALDDPGNPVPRFSVSISSTPAVSSGKTVLLYHADFDAAHLRTSLVNTGAFAAADVAAVSMTSTPLSLTSLEAYDCVIVWTNYAPPNPVAHGDRLKEYVDAGHGLVIMTYGYSSPTSPWELQGGIMQAGYSPLRITTTPQVVFPRSLDFSSALTASPLLEGVSDFTYQGNSNYVDATLDPGAQLVGSDQLGKPVVAVNATGRVAGINLYPGGGFALSAGVYRTIANACVATADAAAVVAENNPPTADAGGPYATTEGQPVELTAAGSIDPDGDALTYAWDLDNDGQYDDATGVTASTTFADDGTYPVGLQAGDPSGSSHTASATVTVTNAAPVVTAVTVPIAPVQVNTLVSLGATFTDVGSADTHTGHFDLDLGGATSVGAMGQPSGSGSMTASHTYTAPGVYTITATVTDDDGGSGVRSSALDIPAYVVVFDPSGSFVTGGGWILSPAGACDASSCGFTGEGKASFGFVSKYLPGRTTPSGNTEFEFKAGGFRFRSTGYDWLVVAGARAQYKGAGEVNGVAGYGFLLTAVDGAVTGGGDRFRIKVWHVASGVVVYDNQRGESDDSDASTALGGGSVVIHK